MLILTLEIQSTLVRGSLVWFKAGEAPEVIFSDERPVPYRPGIATGRFVQATVKALSESVDAVLARFSAVRRERKAEKFPHHIDHAHYVLSSPWIAVQARTLSIDLGRPIRITRAKVRELLETERAKLSTSAEGPTEVIEEKVFEVRLNGYSIAAWQDKEVRNLEISYALGVAGSGALARFTQACERAVSKRHVSFHSSLLLQYVGMRASMPERDTYTLIHAHGELSDVVVVARGACVFFGSYPTGIRSIVRAVAAATKTDIETAGSFIDLYAEKRLEQGKAAEATPIMEKVGDGWIKQLRDLLEQGKVSAAASPDTVIVARFHREFFAEAFRRAYPQAKAEVKQIDESLYARAIRILESDPTQNV